MKKLEKFIRSNISSFENEEPLPGHFERFQKKLDARKPVRRVNLSLVAAAAALAGLILTGSLGLLFNNSSLIKFSRDQLTLNRISPEYNEVENYYLEQISKKSTLLNALSINITSSSKDELQDEFYDLDKNSYLLKQELLKSPKQERIVNAMIQNYQMKIDLLDQMINTLVKIKKENNQ